MSCTNRIVTDGWSNPTSKALYDSRFQDEPELAERYESGDQCGGCSFFATFNADWGLCCCPGSGHLLETVFEHFTCASYVHEGWGPHSFTDQKDHHCRCGGGPWWKDEATS